MTSLRRWVVLLVVLVLPFQAVWASASAYCQHETSSSEARHFGHHAHLHQAQTDRSDSSTAEAKFAVDSDCTVCHATGAACLLPTVSNELSAHRALLRRVQPFSQAAPDSVPSRAPDRPQWVRLDT